MTQGFGEADEFTWVRMPFLNHAFTVAIGEAEIMSATSLPILLVCAVPQALPEIAGAAVSIGWE